MDPVTLMAVERRLSRLQSVPELLARAPGEVATACGFDRGVVATPEGDLLMSGAMPDPAMTDPHTQLSRALRRSPVALRAGCAEAELLQVAAGALRAADRSVLAADLGLRSATLTVIAPGGHAAALLVVDRDGPEATAAELLVLEWYGCLLAGLLERLVLRRRLESLVLETRHLTASAEAMCAEALTAPMNAGSAGGFAMLFTDPGAASTAAPSEMFDARERAIGELLAAGRSNREIAAELYLSPYTVKDLVARLARRLNAGNRTEAAASYARLQAMSDRNAQ